MRRLLLVSLIAFGALAADARACSCVYPDVGEEEFVGACNLMDPAEMGVPAPSPASLLGALLGTCWAAF